MKTFDKITHDDKLLDYEDFKNIFKTQYINDANMYNSISSSINR